MSHPIWIVNGPKGQLLDFNKIMNDEDTYIEAWATIVKYWIFEPARQLSAGGKVTDRGIALLTLELAFFEPFGTILTGKDSDGASHKTFSEGLKEFADWLLGGKLIGESEHKVLSVIGTNAAPNIVYSFARCGLMHKMTMQGGRIFIDALEKGRYAITDYPYKIASQSKGGSIEPAENIFLIDPWRLLPLIEEFAVFFKHKLLQSKSTKGDAYKKFKYIFERSFVDPGKAYFSL